MRDFFEAYHFLEQHPIFYDWTDRSISYPDSYFESCIDVEVVKVCPETDRIERDDDKNTKTKVWLEAGPWENDWKTHDLRLDCGGDTFEEAICKLADAVQKFYGDRSIYRISAGAEKNPGILIMPMGLPGCGKSTFAHEHGFKIIGGDIIRQELFGDMAKQYDDRVLSAHGYDVKKMSEKEKMKVCNNYVWNEVDRRVKKALQNGETVYYDGTNGNKKYRTEAIRKFKVDGVQIAGLYFDVPVAVCKERNASRARVVDEKVIDRMHHFFDKPDSFVEGFDKLYTVDKEGYVIIHEDEEVDKDGNIIIHGYDDDELAKKIFGETDILEEKIEHNVGAVPVL